MEEKRLVREAAEAIGIGSGKRKKPKEGDNNKETDLIDAIKEVAKKATELSKLVRTDFAVTAKVKELEN